MPEQDVFITQSISERARKRALLNNTIFNFIEINSDLDSDLEKAIAFDNIVSLYRQAKAV